MSKLSFRARALDASKPMPVYLADEIPELLDFASVNRAVVEMPTGMEKEEETEHHLQKVLSARLHNEKQDGLVIPIPEMDWVEERYNKLYGTRGIFKPPKQYIHVQPFGMEQDIPEYDMDSEDEIWLTRQVKHLKMEVTPTTFENIMDRLEKASGQTVVSLGEAKALLKVDDELIIAVYDYWLNKRLKQQKALIPQVKMEKRDGSSGNNPYVAFRRRTEKMQTRKNRKNDETSYEKMLKLRKDLRRVLILSEMVKRREKSKKEQLKLTTEIIEKRYQMQDWDARLLEEANAKKDLLPKFVPLPPLINLTKEWGTSSKEPTTYVRKKREYKKRKHKLPAPEQKPLHPAPQMPHYPSYPDLSTVSRDVVSTDDDGAFSPSSPQDDIENEPDGIYTFRRKEGCSYHAPRSRQLGSWPWCSRQDGGLADNRYRYSLASISHPYSRCVGFARHRVGRGGRVLFDRCVSQWDDQLTQLDLSSPALSGDVQSSQYINYIRTNGIQHYRSVVTQRTLCTDSNIFAQYAHSDSILKNEFTVESFQRHQEKLIAMQQQQQQQLRQQELDQDAASRTDAVSSLLASSEASLLRFTLDSERAEFAVSALHDLNRGPESELGFVQHSEAAKPPSRANLSVKSLLLSAASGASVISGTGASATVSHLEQLSTSPAASILQLNYPLNGAVQLPNAPTQMSLSSSSACLSTSLSGSISHPPFVNPQNIKRSLDCVPMSRAVNNFNKAATTKSSFLTRCPTTSVVGRSFPVVTCGSMAPVGPHVPLTVPVGVKSSSQAIIKIGSSSGRTDLLTRENCDVLPNVAKEKAFPMEVT